AAHAEVPADRNRTSRALRLSQHPKSQADYTVQNLPGSRRFVEQKSRTDFARRAAFPADVLLHLPPPRRYAGRRNKTDWRRHRPRADQSRRQSELRLAHHLAARPGKLPATHTHAALWLVGRRPLQGLAIHHHEAG